MIFDIFQTLFWGIAFAALIASAWTDLKDRIIPNGMVGLVAVSGLCLSLLLRPEQTWISLLIATGLIVGLGVLAHNGMMGGGDVKLISATTLLLPPGYIGQLLVFIALAGGALSIVYLGARAIIASRGAQCTSQSDLEADLDGCSSPGRLSVECARIAAGGPMPYAIAILGGVVCTVAGGLS